MITVDKFMWCMKLETGVLAISWFALVGDALNVVFSSSLAIFLSIFDCNDLAKMIFVPNQPAEQFDEWCKNYRTVSIIVLIIVAIIAFGFAVAAFACIKGTKARDHTHVKPLMVILAVLGVLSIFNTALLAHTKNVALIFFGLNNNIFYAYSFIVFYSLFKVFKEEHERGTTAEYHQTMA